jgi:rare lipoprotein A
VENKANGKTVTVRITDRGPFIDGRIIDLSHAAARAIDMIGPGTAPVRLVITSRPPDAPSEDFYSVQVGAFREKGRADEVRTEMEKRFGAASIARHDGTPVLYHVLVGGRRSIDEAGDLATKLRSEYGSAFVVRVDADGY